MFGVIAPPLNASVRCHSFTCEVRVVESDSGVRAKVAVVVTLVDLGNGTSRVVIDDVRSDKPTRDTSWQYDCFVTHKVLKSSELEAMSLPDSEFMGVGEAIIARLLALNRRV
jgi:hypothetical protein